MHFWEREKEMIIEWKYEETEPRMLKTFLKEKKISKKMLAKVKFRGGQLEVNGEEVRVRHTLSVGDTIRMSIPIEPANPYLKPSEKPLDILFEDEHYLIVNKPAGVASVPSSTHREDTMANRIRGYVERNHYTHKTVHVVTRLDRETSGAMIFAKNALAHSMIDQKMRKQEVEKLYQAIISDVLIENHDFIEAPIGRTADSIITREVRADGKPSLTEYWVEERYSHATLVKVKLHTGRTHQIRVHFSHIDCPLLGDNLYGEESDYFFRQALHCSELSFQHPFTEQFLKIYAPLPNDLKELIEVLRGK